MRKNGDSPYPCSAQPYANDSSDTYLCSAMHYNASDESHKKPKQTDIHNSK